MSYLQAISSSSPTWTTNWKTPFEEVQDRAGDLHPIGEQEMRDLGGRFRARFPDVFQEYKPHHHKITSTQVRYLQSCVRWFRLLRSRLSSLVDTWLKLQFIMLLHDPRSSKILYAVSELNKSTLINCCWATRRSIVLSMGILLDWVKLVTRQVCVAILCRSKDRNEAKKIS